MDPERLDRRDPQASPGEQTAFLLASPINVPLNLTEWVKPELLADWVKKAASEVDSATAKVLESAPTGEGERILANLCVLVFAYSTQVYLNDEIIAACHSNPIFQDLCGQKPPFPEELKHFRRRFRALLENTLTRVLVRAVKEKYVNLGELPPGLQRNLSVLAEEHLDTARHIDTWSE